MPNNSPLNNNVKTLISFSKWVAPILGVLVAVLVTWFGSTVWKVDRRVEAFQATYESDQAAYIHELKSMADDRASVRKNVDANSKWIREWYDTLRVPERDQRQDSAIGTLELTMKELKNRIREVERQYTQLGGPNDPLYAEIERLQRAIERLDK